MDDRRLAEIEAEAERAAASGDVKAMRDVCVLTVPMLVGAVRVLRDRLQVASSKGNQLPAWQQRGEENPWSW